jgi:hypothetical protein
MAAGIDDFPLKVTISDAPSGGRTVEIEMDFKCVGCGQVVDEHAKVCPTCGRNKPTALRMFGLPIGPGLFAIAVIAGVYYFFF